MNARPYRRCDRCGGATRDRRCATCAAGVRPRKIGASASQRGYGAPWRKRRAAFFLEEPEHRLCFCCDQFEVAEFAAELHHVKPRREGGSDDSANLRGICAPHHRWITNIETREGWVAAARMLNHAIAVEEIGR